MYPTRTFHLEIVTPDRKVFAGEVVFLSTRTVEGGIGIAANHLPFVATLDIHAATLHFPDGSRKLVSVCGGVLEVRKDRVTILAEAAELPEEIDLDRALRAKLEAEEALQKARDVEYTRAELALRRALVRLQVGSSAEGE
ncbi:MAG: ATP synthase epsilon chain [Brockia lithotrophica]|uniref:ATP synthase epsilon chain n=1 Tax=Brockia lithotrophica TaxID=933949 RepID=A0A2T5GAV8_9BACL|nr:ATP synthase F1 subunit epsilon [Brockia lithotrophica]MBT9253806.1 ATP synthase F1 subunit epsilon [Brockia lithotrophica]PTQ53329.1 MAG: ATP synthase epsilon chain [Brockia lithotrophica]